VYARVTLLEIDTMRTSVAAALELFREHTVPGLQAQAGYRGVYALATPEGKALLMSLWDTEAEASTEGEHTFYSEELDRFTTVFRSSPGRDRYEVMFVDEPAGAR